MNLAATEKERQEAQLRIDAGKTVEDRRSLGQFATPPELARSIARETALFLTGTDPVEILEPSAGTGAFLSAFFAEAACHVRRIFAVELDSSFHDAQKRIWREFPVESRLADFTALPCDRAVDLVVANPPYVRHHEIHAADKKRLQSSVLSETGLRLSGLAGLYCHFMLLSLKWMKPGGLGVWLVPTEWMSVNYGSVIRAFLSERVRLLRVHRFASDDVRFSDALVSSCVVWFRKAPPGETVLFTSGADMSRPDQTESIAVVELRQADKWPPAKSADTTSSLPRLRDFFTIRRGIATGDNPFFIIPEETARAKGLSSAFLKPILPSPRHLKTNRVESDSTGVPVNAQRQFLLDCTGMGADALPDAVRDYLAEGETTTATKKLCAGRTRWYDQEQRTPAPILCSYMGRSDGEGAPVRFILNESDAIATNSFLMLYPKGALRRVFMESTENRESAWRCLLAIPADEFRRAGRCYGGGLQKMEPRELGDLACPELANWLSERMDTPYREDDSGQLLLAMDAEATYDCSKCKERVSPLQQGRVRQSSPHASHTQAKFA